MSTYRNKVQPKSKVILGGSFKKSRNISKDSQKAKKE